MTTGSSVVTSNGCASWKTLPQLLAALEDPHVWMQAGGSRTNPYHARRALRDRDAFDLPQTLERLSAPTGNTAKKHVRYGMLREGVGYIHIWSFRDGDVDTGVGEALDLLGKVDALVADVRGNQGGSQAEITKVVSRFASTGFEGLPTYVLGQRISVPDVVPVASPFPGAVAVLINGNCFSACESFSEMMRRIDGVTLVGDTTAGGGGGFTTDEPGTIPLGEGKATAAIPTAELRHYDGSPMEWRGVPPDVRVPQSHADVEAGVDPQLERAIEVVSDRCRKAGGRCTG